MYSKYSLGTNITRGFVSVCSAVEHSCAVDYLGMMHCWGYSGLFCLYSRSLLPLPREEELLGLLLQLASESKRQRGLPSPEL
jgi:hypothetical protein